MKKLKTFLLILALMVASLPMTGCGGTALNKIAPYVEQAGRGVEMALADYYAAGLISEGRYNELKTNFAPFTKETKNLADYLRSLTTINSESKAEAFRRISEGVALGKRIALTAGLPPDSVVARVLTAAVLGLETTASTIQAVKTPDVSFSSVGSSQSEVPASSVKVKLPKVDEDLKRYFQ